MKKLTVYSKDACPQCVAAKAMLISNGINFEEINTSYDEQAKLELIADGHRSVPQFYLDGQLYIEGGWWALQNADLEQIKKDLNT